VKVARQFTAWNAQKKTTRLGGTVDSVGPPASIGVKQRRHTNKITPSLRDETLSLPIPGSELPGYLHPVPPGQRSLADTRFSTA
jgi:hypothetical protein